MSGLDKKQKVLMSIIYALTGIAAIVIFFVVYNIIAKEKPQTLGTIYASTLSCTEEDINIVEVKIHSNENKNGQSCYEVLWNGYTDYLGGNIKGFGMQSPIIDDYSAESVIQSSSELVYTYLGGITLYNTDDNSNSTYVVTDVPKELYIDIDGKFYKIVFETFTYTDLGPSGWDRFWGITREYSAQYTFYTLFDYICETAMTDSAKYENGEFAIPMLDLSKYVRFYYQDSDTQYKPLDEASTMYELFKIKVTYSKDGMTSASQSMFKQFKGSSLWDYYAETDVEEYWNAYAEVNITEEHMNYVYNEVESAYYITIDERFAKYLSGLSNAEISINLDLTALGFDIYGIDLQNFDFRLKSFEILTDSIEDFKIYNSNSCSLTPTLKAV